MNQPRLRFNHWAALAMLLTCLVARPAAPGNYRNPVLPGDFPDPSVIRVDGAYWATATTSEWGPFFPILYSRDLVHWERRGAVFQQRPPWATGNFWAPEIYEHRGKYLVYYVGRRKGGPLSIAVATADHPEGPYTDHGPLIGQDAGSIDPVPVVSETGELFLIWKEDGNSRKQPTPLWLQKLSDDGTRLVGEMREILRNDAPWEGSLIEGPFVARHGEWFYLFYSGNACCGRGCHYALGVARARKISGPWEKNPANPILAENEDWKCPGHGSIVSDGGGHDFLLYHAYDPKDFVYVGRQGLLDQIEWKGDGWPAINAGRGPTRESILPWPVSSSPAAPAFFDDFDQGKLRPEWQWPQAQGPLVTFDTNRGALLLRSNPEAPNGNEGVLAVQTTGSDYVATVRLALREDPSATAQVGLAAYGDAGNALGITFKGDQAMVWRRQGGKQIVLSAARLSGARQAEIRMTAREGRRFKFAARQPGNDWIEVGGDLSVEGEHLPPWDRGVRVALLCGNDGREAAQGIFDWFNLKTTPRPP